MGLSAGTRLGPYEIVAPLGAGGMGEVYRARDTRLGRDVAVKVLPEDVAGDARVLARFETEARAVAALSHPNILALHDVGKEGAVSFVVMELLEGETLRELLARGPLPLRKALDVGLQVAEGLAAAHGKGIVHRDIKPENVFLTRDGHAKLLDFGLARHDVTRHDPADTRSPTLAAVSEKGVVLGTVAYMSPEQARGETVDFRSDQFSLGTVLYEMLTGKRPFVRDSAAETLTAIIREEPEPLERAAPATPASVRFLVERLLTKEPEGRYDSTRDLARDLATWKLFPSGASGEAVAVSGAAVRPRRTRWLPWAVAFGLAMSLGVVALLLGRRTAQSPRTERFEIVLPEGYRLFTRGGQFLDISPDGKLVVYAAFTWKKPWEVPDAPKLFLHSLDRFQSSPIPGTECGSQPLFSPDGRRIAFLQRRDKGQDLMVVPVEGGTPTTVRQQFQGWLGAWAVDGTFLGSPAAGPLMRFPFGEGKPEPVTTLDEASFEVSHRLPHLLPDGKTVFYTAIRDELDLRPEGGWIYAQRLGEKTRHLLVEGGTDGRFAPPDLLLFGRRGTLMAARLDMSSWKLAAPPEPVLEGVTQVVYESGTAYESGVVGVAVARDGTLVFAPGSVRPEVMRSLAWLDRQGGQTPLDSPKGNYRNVRLSPDGRQALVSKEYPGTQVELLDLERGARRNVTFRGDPWAAIWGPGPDRFTHDSNEAGARQLYTRRLAGPQEETEKLATGNLAICGPGSWSPDGRLFAFVVHQGGDLFHHSIWLLERGGAPRPFLASPFQEFEPEISPDGRYLVYVSNEPGRYEVLVKPLDGSAGPVQVSVGGGFEAMWAHDGSSVYYIRPVEEKPGVGAIFRVAVKEGQGGLAVGRPVKILEGKISDGLAGRAFDLAPDGRFLVVQPPTDTDNQAWWERACPNRIRVVLGGVDSLRREAAKER